MSRCAARWSVDPVGGSAGCESPPPGSNPGPAPSRLEGNRGWGCPAEGYPLAQAGERLPAPPGCYPRRRSSRSCSRDRSPHQSSRRGRATSACLHAPISPHPAPSHSPPAGKLHSSPTPPPRSRVQPRAGCVAPSRKRGRGYAPGEITSAHSPQSPPEPA